MFGAQYFGGLILGVAVAVAPLAQPIPGTDGGGFGSTYFGQYAPGVAVAPPLPPTPPPVPVPGGGTRRLVYPTRLRPPMAFTARASATLGLRAEATARRRAAAAAPAALGLTLTAAPVPVFCGDDEACLAAAMLLPRA